MSVYIYIYICVCLTLFLPVAVVSQHDVPAVLSPPRYGRLWNSCRLAPQSHWAIFRCYSSVWGFVIKDIRWNFDVQGTHLEENTLFFSENNGENMTWNLTVWKRTHPCVEDTWWKFEVLDTHLEENRSPYWDTWWEIYVQYKYLEGKTAVYSACVVGIFSSS